MDRDDLSEPIEREHEAAPVQLVCRDCGHALIDGQEWAGSVCSDDPSQAVRLASGRRYRAGKTGCGRLYTYAEVFEMVKGRA